MKRFSRGLTVLIICLAWAGIVAAPNGVAQKSAETSAACPYGKIQLKRMKCPAAAKIVDKWWAKQMKKPRRVQKVKGFTCRWKGPLNLVSDGRLTCTKGKKKRQKRFSVALP